MYVKSESNKEPKFKSLVPVFIATSVAAGFVILLSVSVYYWMIKFRRHKVLTSHQSRTLLLACEEGEKWSSDQYILRYPHEFCDADYVGYIT